MIRALPPLLLFVLGLLSGCLGHDRLSRLQRLPEEDLELYSKYKQFLTEAQQDEYLALPSSPERVDFIRELKVEQRIATYPQYIQDAIWQQQVVPGMDAQAVLLTWSTPASRDWDDTERANGNDVERWYYQRGTRSVRVAFVNKVVTQVDVEGGN